MEFDFFNYVFIPGMIIFSLMIIGQCVFAFFPIISRGKNFLSEGNIDHILNDIDLSALVDTLEDTVQSQGAEPDEDDETSREIAGIRSSRKSSISPEAKNQFLKEIKSVISQCVSEGPSNQTIEKLESMTSNVDKMLQSSDPERKIFPQLYQYLDSCHKMINDLKEDPETDEKED